jgi:hypothetical protein
MCRNASARSFGTLQRAAKIAALSSTRCNARTLLKLQVWDATRLPLRLHWRYEVLHPIRGSRALRNQSNARAMRKCGSKKRRIARRPRASQTRPWHSERIQDLLRRSGSHLSGPSRTAAVRTGDARRQFAALQDTRALPRRVVVTVNDPLRGAASAARRRADRVTGLIGWPQTISKAK